MKELFKVWIWLDKWSDVHEQHLTRWMTIQLCGGCGGMRSHQRHPVILTRTNKFSYITKTNSVTGQKQIQLGLNLWKKKNTHSHFKRKGHSTEIPTKKNSCNTLLSNCRHAETRFNGLSIEFNTKRSSFLNSVVSIAKAKQKQKTRKRHFHQGNRHTGQPCTFYCLWSIQYSNGIFFHSCTIKL